VLCATDHPLVSGGTNSNRPATMVDLNETSLEAAVIQIAAWTDERGLLIAAKPKKLILPPALQFVATRLLETKLRTGTADNDVNALVTNGSIPGGYTIHQCVVPDHGHSQRAEALCAGSDGNVDGRRLRDGEHSLQGPRTVLVWRVGSAGRLRKLRIDLILDCAEKTALRGRFCYCAGICVVV
jgi:hypothetical protein